MSNNNLSNYPILPLRDVVIFPGSILPLFIGRETSIKTLEHSIKHTLEIVAVTQKNPDQDSPGINDLYKVGTVCTIMQMLQLPDNTLKILVEGKRRVEISEIENNEEDICYGICRDLSDKVAKNVSTIRRVAIDQFNAYIKLDKKILPEIAESISSITDHSQCSDMLASQINISVAEHQEILEEMSVYNRFKTILKLLEIKIEVLNTEHKIKNRVRKQMAKSQKEYYLNEQIKAIQKELTGKEDTLDEISQIEQKIKKKQLSDQAKEKAVNELNKLKSMNPISAEATVIRSYLDWLVSMPWGEVSDANVNVSKVQLDLDQNHYGLNKVKDKIAEYIALQNRNPDNQGIILCFVGPPGVGKTSIASSIAKVVNRPFVKISLGGIKDESEIRGHRRTYIGAMPGRVIAAIKKAGVDNPLILLDEIEKTGMDWKSDPASALLEILDPSNNKSFSDHYLEVDYDLSKVMFVATANSLNMLPALRDRLEIVNLSGYNYYEKYQIAKKYLIPKQMNEFKINKAELNISDNALKKIIQEYTKESGVRELSRSIGNIIKKSILNIDTKKVSPPVNIRHNNLSDYLGKPKYVDNPWATYCPIGTAVGLAWTEYGGDVLYIEANLIPGTGKNIITGKLGDIMQESVQIAISYIKSRSVFFCLDEDLFKKYDVHIHVPDGAVPKDGPSAGITIALAVLSAFSSRPVNSTFGMTGEITLQGKVLKIGGLKEKILAAARYGIKKVIVPKTNKQDVEEMDEYVTKGMDIFYVDIAEEVMSLALNEISQDDKSKDDKIKLQ